jgi:hypothetical protein
MASNWIGSASRVRAARARRAHSGGEDDGGLAAASHALAACRAQVMIVAAG